MKKRLWITAAAVAATLSPMAAQAQTRELQRDRQDVREERREYRDAQRSGDRGDVREERSEYRDAKREYRDAKREYRADWRDYRHSNRNAFRGSRFNAPFRYRTFYDGGVIGTNYYAPRYRVSNYSTYRLRAPGRYQTYVRHFNDVLLVNTRTGRVVRAYRSFYW